MNARIEETLVGLTTLQEDASGDILRQSMLAATRHRLLTSEEEITLGRATQSGDTEARNQLVEHNLRLVISIARAFHRSGVPLLDLIQEGNEGLMRAAVKFNPALGYRFTTYATHWIRQRIYRYILKDSLVYMPLNVAQDMQKVCKAEGELLRNGNGELPTDEAVAQHAQLSLVQVQGMRGRFGVQSMYEARNENEFDLHSALADSAAMSEPTFASDEAHLIKQALSKLKNNRLPVKRRRRMRYVIVRAYGVGGHSVHEPRELARRLKLNVSQVLELLNSAKRLMRRECQTLREEISDRR